MIHRFLFTALAPALAFSQPREAGPNKQIAALIDRIDRVAASEPVEYGIDTRIRTADVLTPRYPAIAKLELLDAAASLPAITDLDYQNRDRVRIVGSMAAIDFVEAVRLAKSIPPERKQDRLAQAFDQLYKRAGGRNGADIIIDGFNAGAYRIFAVTEAPPGAAMQLFSRIVDSFPDSPDGADIDYLFDRAGQFAAVSRDLVFVAVRKTLSASDGLPKEKRRAVRTRAAALLRSLDSALPDEFEPLLLEPTPPPEAKPTEEKKDDDDAPDLSGFSYSEALERALALKNPAARAGTLIELSRREDFTAKQQARVAAEALSAVNQMPAGGDRLFGLSMLSRDFARRGDTATAAMTAQMLSDVYGKVCSCGSPICEAAGDRLQCVDLVNDYAEYLDELHFTQESLGLRNISLEARLLVLRLAEALKAPLDK